MLIFLHIYLSFSTNLRRKMVPNLGWSRLHLAVLFENLHESFAFFNLYYVNCQLFHLRRVYYIMFKSDHFITCGNLITWCNPHKSYVTVVLSYFNGSTNFISSHPLIYLLSQENLLRLTCLCPCLKVNIFGRAAKLCIFFIELKCCLTSKHVIHVGINCQPDTGTLVKALTKTPG